MKMISDIGIQQKASMEENEIVGKSELRSQLPNLRT
jgi:hypothetical protein